MFQLCSSHSLFTHWPRFCLQSGSTLCFAPSPHTLSCNRVLASSFSRKNALKSTTYPQPVSTSQSLLPLTYLWHLPFLTPVWPLTPSCLSSPRPTCSLDLSVLLVYLFFQALALLSPHLTWGSQLTSSCGNSRLQS